MADTRAIDAIANEPVRRKICHLIARVFFRSTYFPPKGGWGWMKVIVASVFRHVSGSFTRWHREDKSRARLELEISTPRQENSGDA
jgi:hypothetical protein